MDDPVIEATTPPDETPIVTPVSEPVIETPAPPPEEVVPNVQETVQTQEETQEVTPPVIPVAPDEAQAPQDDPVPPPAEPTVPLARMQGIQRQLAQAQKDLAVALADARDYKAAAVAADKRAAKELKERYTATVHDIVPSLMMGETIEDVEKSYRQSRAAYAAASQNYARTIPVPHSSGNANAPKPVSQPQTPLEMLRAGLSTPKSDINT